MFTLALQSHDKTKSRDQIMFATCEDGPIRFFQNPYDTEDDTGGFPQYWMKDVLSLILRSSKS